MWWAPRWPAFSHASTSCLFPVLEWKAQRPAASRLCPAPPHRTAPPSPCSPTAVLSTASVLWLHILSLPTCWLACVMLALYDACLANGGLSSWWATKCKSRGIDARCAPGSTAKACSKGAWSQEDLGTCSGKGDYALRPQDVVRN